MRAHLGEYEHLEVKLRRLAHKRTIQDSLRELSLLLDPAGGRCTGFIPSGILEVEFANLLPLRLAAHLHRILPRLAVLQPKRQ